MMSAFLFEVFRPSTGDDRLRRREYPSAGGGKRFDLSPDRVVLLAFRPRPWSATTMFSDAKPSPTEELTRTASHHPTQRCPTFRAEPARFRGGGPPGEAGRGRRED